MNIEIIWFCLHLGILLPLMLDQKSMEVDDGWTTVVVSRLVDVISYEDETSFEQLLSLSSKSPSSLSLTDAENVLSVESYGGLAIP